MNCRDFEEALAGALAGTPASDSAASHLRDCPACRTRARQMIGLHEALLRTLAPYPDSLEKGMQPLLDQVARDLRSPGTDFAAAARERIARLPERKPRGRFFNWRPAIFAAAVAAALFALLATALHRPRPARPGPEARGTAPANPPPAPPPLEKEIDSAPAPKAEPPRPKEKPAPPEDLRPREPQPTPAPEKPVERAPKTDVAPPKKEPGRTFVSAGRLEHVKGSVFLVHEASPVKTPARAGQELIAGQSILTEGSGSFASVAPSEAVRVSLESDTTLVLGTPAELFLTRGRVSIDTAKAAADAPLSLSTPHARVQLAKGHFLLHEQQESTFFETRLGTAQFTNLKTGASVQIPAGQFAVAPTPPGFTQEQITKAIKDGIDYLKKAPSPPFANFAIPNSDPLILLTFIHAGVPDNDPRFQQLLQDMLKAPIERTYLAALQAMVLEELDRVRYQPRIVACAQMLIDSQCGNGQWSYGSGSPVAAPAFDPRPDVATVAKLDPSGRRVKPRLTKKVLLQKTREGPATGDNSNAQYAALGLRACLDAGVIVPAEVLHLAARWWRESQFADKDDRKTPYGGKGWCYFDGKGKVNGSDCCRYTYAAMTTGAVGSLVIYDHMLGKDWKGDPNVRSGLEWLTTNYSVTRDFKWGKEIPGDPEDQGAHFYYLYALERLGTYLGQEKLGGHEWYPDGAAVIVERQRPDGSWQDVELGNQPVWDTCFAILFLRRATRPLNDVASVDRIQKR